MGRVFTELLVTELQNRDANAPADLDAALVAELALWGATADGALDDTEIAELVGELRHLPGLEHFSEARAVTMVDEMASRFASDDAIEARVAEIATSIRSLPMRRASFQLAVWSAARDGEFSESEVAFLEDLQRCLDIGNDEADELVRATIELNET